MKKWNNVKITIIIVFISIVCVFLQNYNQNYIYLDAVYEYESGNYANAVSLFNMVKDYEQSETYIDECNMQIAINSAQIGDIGNAQTYYLLLPQEKAIKTQQAFFDIGKQLFSEGETGLAHEYFMLINDESIMTLIADDYLQETIKLINTGDLNQLKLVLNNIEEYDFTKQEHYNIKLKTSEQLFKSGYYESAMEFNFYDLTMEDKLSLVKIMFEHDAYWNTIGAPSELEGIALHTYISQTPCNHYYNYYTYCQVYNGETENFIPHIANMQCLGFASFVSDILYGTQAEMTMLYDIEQVSIGDHVRLVWSSHSFIVIDISEHTLTVLEVNSDYENCQINWGRTIEKTQIIQEEFFILTRET